MEQSQKLSILYCQYYACWCPGNIRGQGISRRDIDPQSRNILFPASEDLTVFQVLCWILFAHNYK